MSNYIWQGTGDTASTDYDWDEGANWLNELGVAYLYPPDDNDDVYLYDTNIDVLYGLAQSGVDLTSLHIFQSFTGYLGNSNSGQGEYLEIGATTVWIGEHDAQSTPIGSGRILLNLGSTSTTVNIIDSKQSAIESNKTPIRLLFDNASSILNVKKGLVSVALDHPGETATLGTINVSYKNNKNNDSKVWVGENVTLTTWTQSGGQNKLNSGATTVTVNDGKLSIDGTGAYTTLTVYTPGELDYRSTGTITNLNISGKADLSKDLRARTVTNCTLYKGAILYANDNVIFSNGITLAAGVKLSDVSLDVGAGHTIIIS